MPETASKSLTRGAVTLACSSVKELDDEIQKFREKKSPRSDSTELRNAVAHAIDHDVETAVSDYDGVHANTLTALLDFLDRAAKRQLPDKY